MPAAPGSSVHSSHLLQAPGPHLLAHRHRQPRVHQVLHGAAQVLAGAARARRHALAHWIQPRMLHQQHCVDADCLIKLTHL